MRVNQAMSTQTFQQIHYELRRAISPSYQSLLEFGSVQRWIDRLLIDNEDVSIATLRKYIAHLALFCEFASKTPDEIIEDARSRQGQFGYEDLLDTWFKELKDKYGDQRDTAISKLSTILNFFRKNRAELDYELPKKSRGTPFPFKPEIEMLRKAFLSVPPDNRPLRSWILVQSQCGLSEIDILRYSVDIESDGKEDDSNIAFESVRKQYQKGICPIAIVIPRKKTGQTTITFLGEEAISLLNFYGNRLFPWKPDAKDPGRTVRKAFKSIQVAIGERRFRPHTLRHRFKTILDNTGFHPNTVNRMMGHSLGKVQGAYNAPSIEELRPMYLTVYPKLRLFEPEFKDRLGTIAMKDFPV